MSAKELLMEAFERMDAVELHVMYLWRKDCIEDGLWDGLLTALANLLEERREKNESDLHLH